MPRVRHKYISSEFEYQLEMTYDSMKLAPARDIPAEYTLRQFEPDDATAYLELFTLVSDPSGVSQTLAQRPAFTP